jgi:hypothetical protein
MAVATQCTITEVSRKANYTRDGLTVTRVLDVYPYAAVGPLSYEMLGGPRYINGRIIRRLPERDPWLPQCFCESIDTEGMGKFHGAGKTENNASYMLASLNYYDWARLTVTYKTPSMDNFGNATPDEVANASGDNSSEQSEIELATQSFDFSAQQLTLPMTHFKFVNGHTYNSATLANVNSTKVIPRIDYTLQRHYVARRPIAAITSLLGRINKNPFNLGVAIWPAETLRFDGASVQQKITTDGFKFFDITYKFAIMPVYDWVATSKEVVNSSNEHQVTTPSSKIKTFVGWNRIYRPDRSFWDYLQETKDLTKGIYQHDTDITQSGVGGGFNLLFNPRAS